ncbi:transposase [Leisingera methylohalidivorans DSM 14336]|uniref:Transposase n=1 Tax=Leisingera methylohalidivorans DSM 14336 TaxID=999552 RepID=V9VZ84_9RHOB|nr:transposase [Leisingera methylohalidivorans DSM 14336]
MVACRPRLPLFVTGKSGTHPNQIKHWKDQLMDGLTDVFDDKRKTSKE